ncbi:GNAT family N-acetyltransferase [Tumebacillus lipolyticus]|uniref:GNAT family N-acetyltransferase n=1 Tax=Tumebacillus lipolyticus TaxID=1280370 RepID=A0ABW4ZUT9_9BACL
MEHPKSYFSKQITTAIGDLIIEGPIEPHLLEGFDFHEGLKAFRIPEKQKKALIGIAGLPEGRIIIARHDRTIVGYVTYLYPDPMERWSEAKLDNLIELGAIEVAAPYRGVRIAKALLDISFADDRMNDYIVISTEYYWHWDLESTGLTVWEYKEVMKSIMGSVGMEMYATDDPEITSHPANMLMARIGSRIDLDTIETFNEVRFKNRFFY